MEEFRPHFIASGNFNASKTHFYVVFRFFLTGLRILIGWHFLYEGISKLFTPNWSSASYLLESHWLLSGFFHWIASNPAALEIVNLINIWGLILIGFGLFFGLLTRVVSVAGAFLILLYYIANPPFIGFMGETTGEGHYLIVNKNLIEMVILVLFVFIPKYMFYGLDRCLLRLTTKTDYANQKTESTGGKVRREFLKDLVSLPVFGGFLYGLFRKRQWESFDELHLISQPSRIDAATGASPVGSGFASLSDLKSKVPCGKIKNLEISRLICGGNLISGYAHSRDLIYVSPLLQNYFNDEKVLETLRLCEACGINTIILRVDKNTIRVMEKYRKRGGTIQWIAQTKIKEDDIRSDIDVAIDCGAVSAYIHGGISDNYVKNGKVDLLCKAVDYIKQKNVLAGIGGHDLQVPMACEKAGLDPDYYLKTLNSGNYWTAGPRLIKDSDWKPGPVQVVEPEFMKNTNDNIWATTPQQTIEFMKNINKPWIAYKVLGAGAIHPEEGFRYVFENGADFACVGMFDFQIVEDANILNEVLNGNLHRERSWMA